MIKIICVGKIKKKYLKDAIDEYSKRLFKYTNLEIVELDDEGLNNEVVAMRKEKERILKQVDSKSYIILLDREGRELSSLEFSKKINDITIYNSNITFIIGGSYGVDKEIRDISNEIISFSMLTFPHQIFRVLLLEQIYRAYKIINNETYHK